MENQSLAQRFITNRLVALVMTLISISGYAYFAHAGGILAYVDGRAYLMIARRALVTVSAAQFGGVWLPLKQILTLPLIWVDAWYFNGFAGSVISMLSFIVAGVFVFEIGKRVAAYINHDTAAQIWTGVALTLMFALNPNMLYMQATPMSEALLYVLILGAVLYLLIWFNDSERVQPLVIATLFLLGATLTRYEGWMVLAGFWVVIGIISFYFHREQRRTQDNLVLCAIIPGIGPALWLFWNWTIFGNMLYFQDGEYAAPANWLTVHEPSIGHPFTAFLTFSYATLACLGIGMAVIGIVGLAYTVGKLRLHIVTLLLLALALQFVYFVYMLTTGQRPLHVPQINGEMYNMRFGLQMLLALVLGSGSLAARSKAFRVSIVCASIVTLVVMLPHGVDTLNDPMNSLQKEFSQNQLASAAWLRANYDGGPVLMESFGNELPLFESHLPLNKVIYEGSYKIHPDDSLTLWQKATANPSQYVEWIYARSWSQRPDKIAMLLHDDGQLLVDYKITYQNSDIVIYQRVKGPVLAATR